MGSFSLIHWVIIGAVVLLLFGKGRISDIMGDVAKGIKSFKKGMADEDAPVVPPGHINQSPVIDARAEPAKHDAKV